LASIPDICNTLVGTDWQQAAENSQRRSPAHLATSSAILDIARKSRGLIEDQPPPIVTDHRPTWEVVIAHVEQLQISGAHSYLHVEEDVLPLVLTDMRARDALGRAVYGTPLTASNGRDHLIDAYQELLDGCVYLMNELVERNVLLTGQLTEEEVPDWAERSYQRRVRALCLLQIRSAIELRALIKDRHEGALRADGPCPSASRAELAKPPVGCSQGVPNMTGILQGDALPGITPEVLRGLQLISRHLTDSGHDWRTGTDMADVHVAQQWLGVHVEQQRLAERAAHEICPGCKREIDPNTCVCGSASSDHNQGFGHRCRWAALATREARYDVHCSP
jgi:hypothetical protein